MDIKKLGSDYGGWSVDLDSIPDGSTVIDGGLGDDITFCEVLLKKKNVNIIGVDPTERSRLHVQKKNLNNFKFMQKAITKDGRDLVLYKNSNPNHASDSAYNDHSSVSSHTYSIDGISISNLRKKFDNISLIKLDIEGTEYDVYDQCVGVPQICIEFHHHVIKSINKDRTLKIVKFFEKHGYKVISNNQYHEITFLKNANK